MTRNRLAAFTVLLSLTACSHRVPQATVEVIDTSASITPRAERAALDALADQIAHLERGDRLVLIPITGDAANDAGGRVLRLSAPTERETYDADLHRFREQAKSQLATWTASLDPHQSRTDILGTLDVARQELEAIPKETTRRLIVVSDFIEDDGAYQFTTPCTLACQRPARTLASHLREQHGFAMPGVRLCLGRLESTDFAPLPTQRKDAINAFWKEYFAASGQPVEIHFDGTGILADTERSCFGGKP